MKERGFIDIAPEEDAQGKLRNIYELWRQRQGIVPNVVKAVSLRPDLLIANDEFRHAIIWGASLIVFPWVNTGNRRLVEFT